MDYPGDESFGNGHWYLANKPETVFVLFRVRDYFLVYRCTDDEMKKRGDGQRFVHFSEDFAIHAGHYYSEFRFRSPNSQPIHSFRATEFAHEAARSFLGNVPVLGVGIHRLSDHPEEVLVIEIVVESKASINPELGNQWSWQPKSIFEC